MARKLMVKVSPVRFIAALAVIAAWSGAMVVAARQGNLWLSIAAGILFTVPLTSLGEWLVHGVLYHNKLPGLEFIRTIHHHGHHFALFPPARYVQDGSKTYEFMHMRAPLQPFRMADNGFDNFFTSWSQIALHFAAGIPLILWPAWSLTHDATFVWSCLGSLTVISWLLAYIHGCIHTPRDRWIEHQRWYQWLDRHHYIHHIDLGANINFMLPLCDFLFGTQKWQLTEAEASRHPSFEEAKPMAKDIKQGETAKEVVTQR